MRAVQMAVGVYFGSVVLAALAAPQRIRRGWLQELMTTTATEDNSKLASEAHEEVINSMEEYIGTLPSAKQQAKAKAQMSVQESMEQEASQDVDSQAGQQPKGYAPGSLAYDISKGVIPIDRPESGKKVIPIDRPVSGKRKAVDQVFRKTSSLNTSPAKSVESVLAFSPETLEDKWERLKAGSQANLDQLLVQLRQPAEATGPTQIAKITEDEWKQIKVEGQAYLDQGLLGESAKQPSGAGAPPVSAERPARDQATLDTLFSGLPGIP